MIIEPEAKIGIIPEKKDYQYLVIFLSEILFNEELKRYTIHLVLAFGKNKTIRKKNSISSYNIHFKKSQYHLHNKTTLFKQHLKKHYLSNQKLPFEFHLLLIMIIKITLEGSNNFSYVNNSKLETWNCENVTIYLSGKVPFLENYVVRWTWWIIERPRSYELWTTDKPN